MNTSHALNIAVVALYLLAMLAFGAWGRKRTQNQADYLVAGRRLGPFLYMGTMAAVVLGGASTVGGVGLGYRMGLSGMWLVVAIGVGVLLLSLCFSGMISRLRIYTVSDMLALRYGPRATRASGIVMLLYTVALAVTSTGAYATVLHVLLGWDRWLCVLLGGAVVLVYSVVGGMWSITLADQAQFFIKTIGIFFLMLPIVLSQAGGFAGVRERLGDEAFRLVGTAEHGADAGTILTWFLVYTLGLLIGQDIWQRVFTARSPRVATFGGAAAGVYCILYGAAGALIGMGAKAVLGDGIVARDDVYAEVANRLLPAGLGGFVLAAGIAAMMSTASGALIAAATVAKNDVVPLVTGRASLSESTAEGGSAEAHDEISGNRAWVLGLGLLVTAISALMALSSGGGDVVVACLTVAYDLLVGGLLVAIVGGFVWKRGTGAGATAAMIGGMLATVAAMAAYAVKLGSALDGILANEPIYWGLGVSLALYVIVSLLTPVTAEPIRAEWRARLSRSHSATR
ncbi:SSS family solute:Na+ symporter [Falsarthrobacter nasiphocae]|uniref:SSS family solute:Na+ symporter n=2 Tax=Falsarthrobacter nasiphocae TaxID=189863 RepID=A0AAE4C7S6_9MICC|nr:SSS family solute:Na+ symporter [Falsarthrobacter nasiphocae]